MKMIGLARLGKDAEIRYTPAGMAVANLSLSYVCGLKKDGEQYAPSQWIDASLWGKQAEALAQFMTKGSVHCFALSDVHIETFQGQNGPGHKLVGRVDSVELGPRVGGGDVPKQHTHPTPSSKPAGNATPQPDFEDDIPF
jgi:single-strand DNA-binding protein